MWSLCALPAPGKCIHHCFLYKSPQMVPVWPVAPMEHVWFHFRCLFCFVKVSNPSLLQHPETGMYTTDKEKKPKQSQQFHIENNTCQAFIQIHRASWPTLLWPLKDCLTLFKWHESTRFTSLMEKSHIFHMQLSISSQVSDYVSNTWLCVKQCKAAFHYVMPWNCANKHVNNMMKVQVKSFS